jgi:NDP-sugar pyrophosphorylase family protein
VSRALHHDLLAPQRERTRSDRPTKVIILAGGSGTRLRPYTSVLPKPLMPVGDRAILEIVVDQLARQGFHDVTLSVGHLGHLIEAVFGDVRNDTVRIDYVREDAPLGTAGPLLLVGDLDGTFLVLNGDLVTTLDHRELLRRHQKDGNLLTIAARSRSVAIDYGVIHLEGADQPLSRVVGYEEKPVIERLVSMGIYAMEPEALAHVPPNQYFDIPDLVRSLLEAGAPVGAFVYDGLWLDIGRHEDYEQAVAMWNAGELESLMDNEATGERVVRSPELLAASAEVRTTNRRTLPIVQCGRRRGPSP